MRDIRAEDYVDGTDVRQLMQHPGSANTSGIVGVSFDRSIGTWKAHIQFQGKRYYLGSSTDINKAAAMRREAENRLHGEFLDWYYEEHPERRPKTGNKSKEDHKDD